MQIALDQKRLDFLFVLCAFLTLFLPVFWPSLRLTFFAPFLVVVCYQRSLSVCLWMAFLCGLFLDFLSSYPHFGLYALDFCLTLLFLYLQRRHFFADSLSTLPIMTFLFASFSSLILGLLLYIMEKQNVFSWLWALTDLILMPAADALYAFVCFILPALFFSKPQRKAKDYFLS